jgi:hypothetical protein
MAGNIKVIWVGRQVKNSEKQKYFFKGRQTGFDLSGKSPA